MIEPAEERQRLQVGARCSVTCTIERISQQLTSHLDDVVGELHKSQRQINCNKMTSKEPLEYNLNSSYRKRKDLLKPEEGSQKFNRTIEQENNSIEYHRQQKFSRKNQNNFHHYHNHNHHANFRQQPFVRMSLVILILLLLSSYLKKPEPSLELSGNFLFLFGTEAAVAGSAIEPSKVLGGANSDKNSLPKLGGLQRRDDEADSYRSDTSSPSYSSSPPLGSAGSTNEQPPSSEEDDESTRIPYEDDADHSTTHTQTSSSRNNHKTHVAQKIVTTTTSTQKPISISTKRPPPALRVTHTDVLPFDQFNVQQPAFSDLIKIWPPTTQQQAAAFAASHSQQTRPNQINQHQRGQFGANNQAQTYGHGAKSSHSRAQQSNEHDSAALIDERQIRNHLNEDLDDTMVTADQSFERDQVPEPPTWINYLGELGDYIYQQLRLISSSVAPSGKRVTSTGSELSSESNIAKSHTENSSGLSRHADAIEELLDDYYYNQYENSQVLYYGAQLVREGEMFEVGCYLPSDQAAEWTKSGRQLASSTSSSPRVIRRSDFLAAKQNYTLKVFEASVSDSGNYRCTKMSRKYHKLVVVPHKTNPTQLYLIQQRLLSVVSPHLLTAPIPFGVPKLNTNNYPTRNSQSKSNRTRVKQEETFLLPGHLVVENQPLVVNCNITDEFVLRRLRENPLFQLAWFKNGKQMKANPIQQQPYSLPSSQQPANQSPLVGGQSQRGSRQQQQQTTNGRARLQMQPATSSANGERRQFATANQRIQFLQANGRQMYIASAQYSDAGDYLCSWFKLLARQEGDLEDSGSGGEYLAAVASGTSLPTMTNDEYPQLSADSSGGGGGGSIGAIANYPLAAGSQLQLMAPVKLRPFKSTYHVRRGNELRLACLAQRGYPAAHISWYVGNRLVDEEFLREHGNEFKILQFQNQQLVTFPAAATPSSGSSDETTLLEKRHIVEINPIPSSRQQMQLTANGRGQWVEYREPKNERYNIDTVEQRKRYLQQRFAQLTGNRAALSSNGNGLGAGTESVSLATDSSSAPTTSQQGEHVFSTLNQASLSVLVINSLNIERHTSRYACRATTRVNTDEVTTVIRVQASSTVVSRPSTGKATLFPGQPLYLQCSMVDKPNASFLWYKREVGNSNSEPSLLDPGDDMEIHNERVTIHKPNMTSQGDYICQATTDARVHIEGESAVIKVRAQPYIEDFGVGTSHTGASTTITDGGRLELICTVRDTGSSGPVNITWLRSQKPDDQRIMVPLSETNKVSPKEEFSTSLDPITIAQHQHQTHIALDTNIYIEEVGHNSKRLIINSVSQEHRSYYACMADNGITDRARKIILIRVKDKYVALWPFFGIVAELLILFIIIHVWETQRAHKEVLSSPTNTSAPSASGSGNKRPASGASGAFESVPLTSG